MTRKHNGWLFLLFAVLFLLLGAGFYQLFSLRFGSGDIYPEYSTYRADPKGAKILFQSLEDLPGVAAQRQLKPLGETAAEETAVMFLGGRWGLVSDIDEDLRPFVTNGGRAIIAYFPFTPRISRRSDSVDEDDDDEPAGSGVSETNACETCEIDVEGQWNVHVEHFTRSDMQDFDQINFAFPATGNGTSIPWKSALWFDELGEEWSVLYRFLEKPVIIERVWGEGSVVLLADSYLFSNEAMVRDRQTELLIRLMGGSERILFDEMHLGVNSREGVMMLVNRYRMQGVLAALFILAGLFIWQRTTSFIPRHRVDDENTADVGTDIGSMAGFTNLLQRHIPQKQLLDTMMEEWRATFRRSPTMQRGKFERVEEEFRKLKNDGNKVHPVDVYNRLIKVLNERK